MKISKLILGGFTISMLIITSFSIAYAEPAPKVDVCHLDADTGIYHKINISENALPAHLEHGDGGPGEDVPGMPSFIFSATCEFVTVSCQAIRDASPNNEDGEYVRIWNIAGPAFSVYCHDMAGTPTEYLSLQSIGEDMNFSQYTAGGASSGTDVRTRYSKLRLNVDSLVVDTSDQSFSSSTGSLYHPDVTGYTLVTSMPYGVAMDCISTNSDTGVANIDLTGTPFQIHPDEVFILGGNFPAGSATFDNNHQVVSLQGGGYCGWINPSPGGFNPFNNRGGFLLNLGFLP